MDAVAASDNTPSSADGPPPSLYAAVLHALSNTDPYAQDISSTLQNFTTGEGAWRVECLPAALAGVLRLLRGDHARLRNAVSVAVELDFFEATREIMLLALSSQDSALWLAAATLGGNPAVDPLLRQSLAQEMTDDPSAQIRLRAEHALEGTDEQLLHEQAWPGARGASGPFHLAPVVVFDTSLPALNVLTASLGLLRTGATLRRLVPRQPLPDWFGPQTVAVCTPATATLIRSTNPDFEPRRIIEGLDRADSHKLVKLVRRINNVLPGPPYLTVDAPDDEGRLCLDPAVYHLGVYRPSEASYLTSASVPTLHDLTVKGFLKPMESRRTLKRPKLYWRFSDIVAVRTWRFLKRQSGKHVPHAVIPALRAFTGHEAAVEVAVTSAGRVFVDEGQGWYDIINGDRPLPDLDLTSLDRVFRPFEFGGRDVPGLLQVSANTVLDPAILYGAPRHAHCRITAKALYETHQRGGSTGVEQTYPALAGKAYRDTVDVGACLREGS